MTTHAPRLIASGLMALDLVPVVGRPDMLQPFGGGTSLNVALNAALFDREAILVGRLAPDEAGAIVTGELRQAGVDVGYAQLVPASPTPIFVQRNTGRSGRQAEPSFSMRCLRCGQHLPGFAPITLKTAAAASLPVPSVFFLDRSAPGILALARAAREQGALIVYEPRRVDRDNPHDLKALGLAHVLKYSEGALGNDDDLPRHPLLEVETRADLGLRYRGGLPGVPSQWVHLPAVPAERVVDPAGAGDALTAGFLHAAGLPDVALLENLPPHELEQALRFGQVLAAWNCGHHGARGGWYSPDANDLVRLLERTFGVALAALPWRTVPCVQLGAPPPMPTEDAMLLFCPACRSARLGAIVAREAAAVERADEWNTIDRPGYIGARADEAREKLDAAHGPGNWRVVYLVDGEVTSRDDALVLYADAYTEFLRSRPDVLEWLVSTASNVYDLDPADVEAGTDFARQRPGSAHHLQDIAIRIALERLGRRFRGGQLLRVRGRTSPGHILNPGQVPFHRPDLILEPELRGWWQPGLVESFWQSNKVLQVRTVRTGHHRRRILVFGGSFNPPHNGHLALARHARDRLGFDEVVFVPNGDNYRKADLAPASTRLAMVERAIAGERGFRALDVEVHSSAAVRTPETMRELRKQYPDDDLFLLRGLDSLGRTHRRLFEIPGLRILTVDREGTDLQLKSILARRPHLRDNQARIDYKPGEFSSPLSSTDIRRAVALGEPVDHMVPAPVAAIIREQGLYAFRNPGVPAAEDEERR